METEEFNQLVTPLLQDIANLTRSYFYPNTTLADDAQQTAVFRAWEKRDELKDPASFKPWVMQIVVRTCHNMYEKEQRRSRHTGPSIDIMIDNINLVDPASLPNQGADLFNAGQRVLDILTEPERLAIILRYQFGYNSSEIEQLTGIIASTIRTRIQRGLTKLRKHLKGE